MFLAYNYARKKYKEREQRKAELSARTAPAPPVSLSTGAPDIAAGDVEVIELVAPVKDTSLADDKVSTTPQDEAEKKRMRKYRLKIMLGLVAPFTLQALDTTIIASALPYIAMDFDQVSQLNWIISAFNLTSAAFLPFWAQIADIFGRHTTIQTTILIMVIGSAICTGAPTSTFGALLLGRSLQGIGAAGVNISVRTILADKVSLKDYAINWTVFILISSISLSVGPVIGGYLTEASWRWCFAINLPVGAVGMILVALLLRRELLGPQPLPEVEGQGREISSRRSRFLARISTIDFGGQMLFLWGLGLLILAFTWAGGTYAWSSAAVLAPLVIGAALAITWLFYEYSMTPPRAMSRIFPFQRPMIPWVLLEKRDIGILFYSSFTVGMSMFSVLYFMDFYFALVEGNSSSKAGISLLYFLPGAGAGSFMAMYCSNVWPRQTFPALMLGAITSACGITILPWAIQNQKTNVVYGMMALAGHGIGMRMNPASLHALAYFPSMTATITSLTAFAMPFGGTISLTLMSTVFNNKSGAEHVDAKSGIRWGFVVLIPFMWLCVLLTTFLGNVWINKAGGHEVVNEAYLWSLVRGKKLLRESRTRTDDNTGQDNGLMQKSIEHPPVTDAV